MVRRRLGPCGGRTTHGEASGKHLSPSSKYDGVRPIHVYLLRLLYVLMFFVLGKDCWTKLLTHQGPWDPYESVAWCVWTGFAMLAGLGISRPLRMLPIVLLEIFDKLLWLGMVAYPLWAQGPLVAFTPNRRCIRFRLCHSLPTLALTLQTGLMSRR